MRNNNNNKLLTIILILFSNSLVLSQNNECHFKIVDTLNNQYAYLIVYNDSNFAATFVTFSDSIITNINVKTKNIFEYPFFIFNYRSLYSLFWENNYETKKHSFFINDWYEKSFIKETNYYKLYKIFFKRGFLLFEMSSNDYNRLITNQINKINEQKCFYVITIFTENYDNFNRRN